MKENCKCPICEKRDKNLCDSCKNISENIWRISLIVDKQNTYVKYYCDECKMNIFPKECLDTQYTIIIEKVNITCV